MRMYNEDVDVKNIRHIFFITTTEKRNDFFPPPPFKKIFFEIKFSDDDLHRRLPIQKIKKEKVARKRKNDWMVLREPA